MKYGFYSQKAAELYGTIIYESSPSGNTSVVLTAVYDSKQTGEEQYKWDDVIYVGPVYKFVNSNRLLLSHFHPTVLEGSKTSTRVDPTLKYFLVKFTYDSSINGTNRTFTLVKAKSFNDAKLAIIKRLQYEENPRDFSNLTIDASND